MTLPYLHPTAVRRDRRNLMVSDYAGGRELVFEDCTGDVELILDLLREAQLTREALIMRMTGRRDGFTAAAVDGVLDQLEALGLIGFLDDVALPV